MARRWWFEMINPYSILCLRRLAALLVPAFMLLAAGCAGYPYPPHVDRLLTPGDRKLLVETAQTALEKGKTGESTSWSNPETQVEGTVTPVQTYGDKPGPPCRKFNVAVTIQNKIHQAFDSACRLQEGGWKSVNHPGLAGERVFEGLHSVYSGGVYQYNYYPHNDPFYYDRYTYPRTYFGFGYHKYW
jgi:hypothetical protein